MGDRNKERVYLFERNAGGTNEWDEVQKIKSSDTTADRNFGHSLGLHGDLLIVGAPGDDELDTNTGAAYVFERTAGVWNSVQKLFGAAAGFEDYFGRSVDAYDGIIAVGSPGDAVDMGAVFIFDRTGADTNAPWSRQEKLSATVRRTGDNYGGGVTLDRTILVVGVPGYTIGDFADGEAFVYGRNEGGTNVWGEITRLSAPVSNNRGDFGAALALADYTLAIGSTDGPAIDSVSIYRLKFNDAPAVATALSDQVAQVLEAFGLTVPSGTFGDPDPEDTLILSAAQAGGSPLGGTNSWLSFDPDTQAFSGLPLSTGSVDVVLVATDLDGESATNAFRITVISTNELISRLVWKVEYFGLEAYSNSTSTGESWSDDADGDGDDLLNIAEYVFGTDPTVSGTIADHELVVVYEPSLEQVSVSYNRRTNDPTLVYVLEVSFDSMQTWQDASPWITGRDAVPLRPDIERAIDIFTGLGSNAYFRVRVFY